MNCVLFVEIFSGDEVLVKGVGEALWLLYHESIGRGNFLEHSLDELGNCV
jgi:hypothetical protein